MRTLYITTLFLAALVSAGFAQNTPKPRIEVTLSRQDPLRLRVTLTSGSARAVTLYRADLPWGNRNSMVFAATNPDGEALDLWFPIDDPGPTQISVKPGEMLTGEVDLRNVIKDLGALKKSDVLLFWAYKSPSAIHLPHWAGGLVVIPQQK